MKQPVGKVPFHLNLYHKSPCLKLVSTSHCIYEQNPAPTFIHWFTDSWSTKFSSAVRYVLHVYFISSVFICIIYRSHVAPQVYVTKDHNYRSCHNHTLFYQWISFSQKRLKNKPSFKTIKNVKGRDWKENIHSKTPI